MIITRRTFLARSATAAGALIVLPSCGEAKDAPSRELLVNHVGFTPAAGKCCLMLGAKGQPFEVVNVTSNDVVHRGTLTPRKGDHGDYLAAVFSEVRDVGEYRIRAGAARSGMFAIADDVYRLAIRNSIGYFKSQRCGEHCHLDDGVRKDDGKHQEVTGGWHDACDVRRWLDATIYGMIGLSRVRDHGHGGSELIDEMRWGNRYFLKMQDPAGFVMYYCGGDDGNHFTDNKIGTADDRRINTDPAEVTAQFNFIAAQAATARLTRDADPQYAKTCENAAKNALSWCLREDEHLKATAIAAAAAACVQLHRMERDDRHRDLASTYLRSLVALQDKTDGFFLNRAGNTQPSREIMDGNLPLLALCDALEHLGDHPDAPAWRSSLQRHVDHLVAMSQLSAFGTIPFGLYAGNDPGGGRRFGKYFYRWFMKPRGEYRDDDWWVGVNAHLASHGVGLSRAAKLLSRPELAHLAQRQLDWILGVNPLNASTVTGAGRNQPRLFKTGAFTPPTGLIPGGVMNGLGGTAADDVCLDPGSWQTCEYWTPMVAYTMWLMSELSAT
jgi:hypothetical protein